MEGWGPESCWTCEPTSAELPGWGSRLRGLVRLATRHTARRETRARPSRASPAPALFLDFWCRVLCLCCSPWFVGCWVSLSPFWASVSLSMQSEPLELKDPRLLARGILLPPRWSSRVPQILGSGFYKEGQHHPGGSRYQDRSLGKQRGTLKDFALLEQGLAGPLTLVNSLSPWGVIPPLQRPCP